VKQWFKDLRYLRRGDRWFLIVPGLALALALFMVVGLASGGYLVALVPAAGFISILAVTITHINDTVQSRKLWAVWEAKHAIAQDELDRIRKEEPWKL
jgi:hypothetical protein